MKFVLPLLLLCCFWSPLHAQPREAPLDALSEQAQVSLLTVLPGDAVYSAWGHSALRVVDPAQGLDVSFNYGTFTFDASFLPRFLYGELDYYLSVQPSAGRIVDLYLEVEGRPTIEQVLHLDDTQREALYAYLRTNALPQNRTYRYHFLYDNCSTRIRDALEATLADALAFPALAAAPPTFREMLDPALRSKPALDFGIDLVLGAPVDAVPTPRQALFLPIPLMEALESTTLAGRPLVARTDTLTWRTDYPPAPAPPWALLATTLLLGVGLVATFLGRRRGRPDARWLDAPLFFLTGLLGVVIVFLWFFSLHDVTARNAMLLFAWPTHLLVLWPVLRRRRPTWLKRYLLVAATGAIVAALGWGLWPQALHPAALPVAVLLAVRCLALLLGPAPRRTA